MPGALSREIPPVTEGTARAVKKDQIDWKGRFDRIRKYRGWFSKVGGKEKARICFRGTTHILQYAIHKRLSETMEPFLRIISFRDAI